MAARLGAACRASRVQRGLSALDIASAAGVNESTISRFEHGDGWRRETDRIVAAYARETGTTPDDLWQAALQQNA